MELHTMSSTDQIRRYYSFQVVFAIEPSNSSDGEWLVEAQTAETRAVRLVNDDRPFSSLGGPTPSIWPLCVVHHSPAIFRLLSSFQPKHFDTLRFPASYSLPGLHVSVFPLLIDLLTQNYLNSLSTWRLQVGLARSRLLPCSNSSPRKQQDEE